MASTSPTPLPPIAPTRPPPDTGAVVGIIVGTLVAVIVGLLTIYLIRKRLRKKAAVLPYQVPLTAPIPKQASLTKAFGAVTKSSAFPATKDTTPTPVPRDSDGVMIPADDLTLYEQIGHGAFGTVFRGEWHGAKVAVKMLRLGSISPKALAEFQSEAETMTRLRPHPNVVQFLGVCQKGPDLCIISGFIPGGSLLRLIQSDAQLPLDEKLHLAEGVGAGLVHLASENVVHRDLAARNILIETREGRRVPLICDFGMSRTPLDDGAGHTQSDVGPVKWMAPECISNKKYSQSSDVWAFGVLLFEVFAREAPYKDIPTVNVAMGVSTKTLRLSMPTTIPDAIRELINDCMAWEAVARPSPKLVHKRLVGLLTLLCGEPAPDAVDSGPALPRTSSTVNSAGVKVDPGQRFLMDDAYFDIDSDNLGRSKAPQIRRGWSRRKDAPPGNTSPRSSAPDDEVPARVAGTPQRMLYHVFRGRVSETKRLRELLLSPEARCVSVVGRGGMGKTCMTLRVLHELEREPGVCGIAYAGCRTSGADLGSICSLCAQIVPKKSPAAAALAELAGFAGNISMRAVCERLLATLIETLPVTASGSAQGMYLVFIDNIEDIQDAEGNFMDVAVKELFETICTATGRVRLVVTTRVPLVLPPALRAAEQRITMESGLDEAEGVALLRDLDPSGDCGLREGDLATLKALVLATHGVPRAMEVIVSMLAADPFLKPDAVLARLKGEHASADDPIAALVKDAFSRLDATDCRIVEALAVFNVPVPLEGIEHVLGLAPTVVAKAVRRMARVHQIQVDRASGRVSVHALDVAYALSQLAPAKRQQLERDAGAYYRSIQVHVADMSKTEAIDLLLQEMVHLVAAGDYDDAAHALVDVDANHKCYLSPSWPFCGSPIALVIYSQRYAKTILNIVRGMKGPGGVWKLKNAGMALELEVFEAVIIAFTDTRTQERMQAGQAIKGVVMKALGHGPVVLARVCLRCVLAVLFSSTPPEQLLMVATPAYMHPFTIVMNWPIQPGAPGWEAEADSPPLRAAITDITIASPAYIGALCMLGRVEEARKCVEDCCSILERFCPPGRGPSFLIDKMKFEIALAQHDYEYGANKLAPTCDMIEAGMHPLRAVESQFGLAAMRVWNINFASLTYLVKSLMGTRTRVKVLIAALEAYIELPQVQLVMVDLYSRALAWLAYVHAHRLRDPIAAMNVLSRVRELPEGYSQTATSKEVMQAFTGMIQAVIARNWKAEQQCITTLAVAIAKIASPLSIDPHPKILMDDAALLEAPLAGSAPMLPAAHGLTPVLPHLRQGSRPNVMEKKPKRKSVFLSYGRSDTTTPFAKKLVSDLVSCGFTVWMDLEYINIGEDFMMAIGTALEACECIVALIDAKYCGSTYCKNEMHMAKQEGSKVFPCLLEDIKMPPDLKYSLATINYIRFDLNPFEKAFAMLVAGMEKEHITREWNPFVHASYPKPRRLAIVALLSLVARDSSGQARYSQKSYVSHLLLPPMQRICFFVATGYDS